MSTKNYVMICILVLVFIPGMGYSQTPPLHEEIRHMIELFKQDPRGPYQAIRWFCPDGTMVAPPKRCVQTGGFQHGLLKDRVQQLADQHQIFLSQILAGTLAVDFWDGAHQNSRLKQYQMERFLQRIDDGWIMRKARYYRGCIQAEDEEEWGLKFFRERLASDDIVESYFFLLRESSRDIPHGGAKNKYWDTIRANSKNIADIMPAFADLRVKLHGQPDENDLQSVREFRKTNSAKLTAELEKLFKALIDDLETVYKKVNVHMLELYLPLMPKGSPLTEPLRVLVAAERENTATKCEQLTDLIWMCRSGMLSNPKGSNRLTLLDLSNQLETLIFTEMTAWAPETIGELLVKTYLLAKAGVACGYMEKWEWEMIEPFLIPPVNHQEILFRELDLKAAYARRAVDWGTGMFRTEYRDLVDLFTKFEPAASGFLDDRIRVSLLLHLGETAARLSELVSEITGVSNRVMGIKNQNSIKGLNPGLVVGVLEVIPGFPEHIEFSDKKIYVMEHPPADLKPVAGILTVSEGNLVSHVQLLARNLGIPNAVLSQQNFIELKKYHQQKVFYAVSPRGAVIMVHADDMSPDQKQLVEESKRPEMKLSVPVDKINLDYGLRSLKDVKTSDSGKICGPKAANLGQLKHMFPEHVPDGLVIPFGVFRKHFDQKVPGYDLTYWEFLHNIFKEATLEREQIVQDELIEKNLLQKLSQFRQHVQKIPFLPGFEDMLNEKFHEFLGTPMGKIPVFVRSDTNMEDLKDFTGAGLNLTVFNVLDPVKIMQAIRDVWASPYSERSYKWRQKYLFNPEDVYPSILILPTINVNKSGVMVTTGIPSSDETDITVAFSKGPGGAVEGQAAESYLLKHDGTNLLLSPSRESSFTFLPPTGGKLTTYARFARRILSENELDMLRKMAENIKTAFASLEGNPLSGPYDIELGFQDDRLWLFQVRPYVENKKIRFSLYLHSIDPEIPATGNLSLSKTL